MKTRHTLLALAILGVPALSSASGFSLNEQSIKSLGSALAGRSSAAVDATTVYGNPAGMARLEGTHLSANATMINAPADIKNASGFPATGTNDGDMVPLTFVGSNFIASKINDRFQAGFGIYAPFGLATNYENSFQGRYFGDKSKVKVISMQPAASFSITPDLSVGLGWQISRIEGILSRAVSPLAPGSMSMIKGSDVSDSFNAGVLWSLTDDLRVGLSYHGETDYTLTGTTTITNLPTVIPGGNGSYSATLDIATPASWELSLTHRIGNSATLHASASRTEWGILKELVIHNAAAPAAVSTVTEELEWHDTWMYSVGGEWKYNELVTLRAGLGHDEAPINDAFRSVRVPSADRDFLTVGLSYQVSDTLSVDMAYEFIKEDKAVVNVSNVSSSYYAEYDGVAHLLGVQANLRF